ncbi:MAG TPA: metal-dependent hydrolase [Pyrinomonadaceae bacterium]|jgi:inner membrane protein|nr:metal-dependent hydrolase [Pyrinomonadaceae bacterium]
MATIFSHALAALALGKVYTEERMPARFWTLAAACAVLPDADVVTFIFGVRYGDVLGHRGLSHSLLFALVVGCIAARLAFSGVSVRSTKFLTLAAYFFAATASHAVLDALTNGGLGVAFFSPFDTTRYFFPWRPIKVSPIGLGFFSRYGLVVLMSEIVWIWLPSIALVLVAWAARKIGKASSA